MGVDDSSLIRLVLSKAETSGLSDAAQFLVLAALEGDAALAQVISGDAAVHDIVVGRESKECPRTYLRSVTVEGFRGVGQAVTLDLTPGPGLVLVVGRNGSGKSSLAEAVEVAFTGTSLRWKDRPVVWRDGWRSLHFEGPSRVEVEVQIDGDSGVSRIVRTWPGDDVDQSQASLRRPRERSVQLDEAPWHGQLAIHRPFLSYVELGRVIDGRPSEMYDTFASILGFESLSAADTRLRMARRDRDRVAKVTESQRRSLHEALVLVDDERAVAAAALLSSPRADLDRLRSIASGARETPNGERRRLQLLSELEAPTDEALEPAIKELVAASEELEATGDTDAAEADRLASLLRQALNHYERHLSEPTCPVCRTPNVLDAEWGSRTREQIEQLILKADHVRVVRDRVARASRDARRQLTPCPDWVPTESPLRTAWERWSDVSVDMGTADLIAHLESVVLAFRTAIGVAAADARARLEVLEDRWEPLSVQLSGWVEQARLVRGEETLRVDLRAACDWLTEAGRDLRNDRLRPLADQAARIWEQMRQESNVQLGPVTLDGVETRRRLILDVTVDGSAGSALGVMSQGELHALALALFLPRATMADSPFRFLIIDDPVQSMDPAKVSGLARVLVDVAQDRQVIVFTHDDRLAEAVRLLRLPATVHEVVRSERSVVAIKDLDDPARRSLDDARAVLRTMNLPAGAAARVVPGLCRTAIEATLLELLRRRRTAGGVAFAQIDKEVATAVSSRALAAAALLGDRRRGSEVKTLIAKKFGSAESAAFESSVSGGHAAHIGDLDDLVVQVSKLVRRIRDER